MLKGGGVELNRNVHSSSILPSLPDGKALIARNIYPITVSSKAVDRVTQTTRRRGDAGFLSALTLNAEITAYPEESVSHP
jgi:hypothetical protein